MPAPKKDADTGTPELGAVVGNVTAISDEMADVQALVLQQQEMIENLATQVEHLSKTARSDESVPTPEWSGPPPLPDGWRRYSARFTELTLIRVPGKRLMIEGEKVFQEAIAVDFSGGVYETGDPDEIAWLESHPDFNQTFWVDEYATRRHSIVELTTGVKTTEKPQMKREPLAAPMK